MLKPFLPPEQRGVCVSAVARQMGRECHSQGQHCQEKGPAVMGFSSDTGAFSSQRVGVGVGAGGSDNTG